MMTKLRPSQLPSVVRSILRAKGQAHNPETPQIDLVDRETPFECQKSSKFAQLPEDILLLFSRYLDKATTAKVIQTCRHLHHVLEATLYTHLSPLEFWYSHRVDLLHRTLVGRPELISHIRSYRGSLMAAPTSFARPLPKRTLLDRLRMRKVMESPGSYVLHITESEAFENAVFIFTKATDIVDLDFTDYYDWASDPIFAPIKTAVCNMSLTRLYLWHCAVALEVLRAQPELELLQVGWDVPGLEGLDKRDIPKLRSLTSTIQDASYIVPGGPVVQFDLVARYEGPDFDLGLFKSLSLSTGPITQLTMCLYRAWDVENSRMVFQVLSPNLPHLEKLAITVGGYISGQLVC